MKNEVISLWEQWRAAYPAIVILFVGDHPTTLSASSVCQVVCESKLIIHLTHACWIINEVLHLLERWRAACHTTAILFVGDPQTSLLASSVCQVLCETTLIIQLHSRMLDKGKVLHLYGNGVQPLQQKCNSFRRRSSDDLIGVIHKQVVCESTLIIQLHSRMLD